MLIFPTEIITKMGQEGKKEMETTPIVRIPVRPRSSPDLTKEEIRAKINFASHELNHARLLMVLGLMEILVDAQREREDRDNQTEN